MPEPETTPPACETGDVRTCTIACPEHGNPDACGAACSEQHTYRLNECALACKEIGGGVADRSWTVPCSLCGTKIGFPCYDSKGRASGISHGKRWDAYDRAEVAARRAAKASPAVPVPGLRDQIAGVFRVVDGEAPAWTKRDAGPEAHVDAVMAVVQPVIDKAQQRAETAEAMTAEVTEALRLANRELDAAATKWDLDLDKRTADLTQRAEQAEAALARVRDLVADMQGVTGARWWAALLAAALSPPVPADQPEGGVG